jgi:hypothetical protein
MPIVPTYQPGQVAAAGIPDQKQTGITDSQAEAFSAPAKAWSKLGESLDKVAEATQKYALARAGNDAQTAYAAASDEERVYRTTALEKQGTDAVNSTKEEMAKRRDDFLNTMASHEGQQFKATQAETASALVKGAIDDATTNYRDPTAIDKARSQIDGAMATNARGLPEAALSVKRREAYTNFHGAMIDRIMTDSPARAKAYLNAHQGEIEGQKIGDFERAIDAEAHRHEVEGEQRNAVARQDFLGKANDYAAYVRAGNPATSDFPRAKIVAVLGDKNGPKIADEVERAEAFGQAYAKVSTATPDQINGELSARHAELQASPENFVAKSKEYGALVDAVQHRQKLLDSDPGGYVLQNAPGVKSAFDVLNATQRATGPDARNQHAQAVEHFAQAALAEQNRLGVRPEAQRILPASYADALSKDLAAGTPEKVAQTVQSLSQEWGAHWPMVYGQLSKTMQPAAVVIGSGMEAGAATRLAEAAKLDREDTLKTLPKDTPALLRDALGRELEPFAKTLAGQVGGQQTLQTWWGETEKLALFYASQGDNVQRAVRRAANETVLDRYDFRDGFRVPKAFDGRRVERGASRFVDDKLAAVSLALPSGAPSEAIGRDALMSAIKSRGEWVTAPDESGLALMLDGSAVRTQDGSPLTVPFDQLQDEGR